MAVKYPVKCPDCGYTRFMGFKARTMKCYHCDKYVHIYEQVMASFRAGDSIVTFERRRRR